MPSNLSKDDAAFYKEYGITPPEHVEHLSDEQMETVTQRIQSTQHHSWHQGGRDNGGTEHGGNDIWCSSCTHVHGFHVEPTKILTGTDSNGNPEFRNIDTK